MSKELLLKALSTYEPSSVTENINLQRILTFVKHTPCATERYCFPGHLTASAWLLNHTADKVLLTHHKKLNKWLQLGGHVDGHWDLLQAAMREGIEESGIHCIVPITHDIFDLDVHWIPARKDIAGHYHYDVRYAFQVTEDIPFVVSDESHDLQWVGKDEIESLGLDESTFRLWRKTTSGKLPCRILSTA